MTGTNSFKIIAIIVIFTFVQCKSTNLKFPKGFFIGAASSAYQIEGAWNADDKTNSTWDYFVHNDPENIDDHSTGDVACDSFNKFDEDVNMLKHIGVDHYRFSMSWTRILPLGHAGYVSQSAISYYHKLLDALESKGIVPFVTIYHWDHPQSVEEMGGWLNESTAYMYADYAKVVFSEFAHRVKYFITMNEPSILCTSAYRGESYPPNVNLQGLGDYMCVHNLLKGHALAYHTYNKKFRKKYNGNVGITMQCKNFYSKNGSKNENSDVAADVAFEFECGWQAHPIFSKTGDYPEIMKQRVAERSKAQGYSKSRLPVFTKYWIEFIRGSSDFLGLNHYTSILAESLPESSMLKWPNDEGLVYSYDPKWPTAQSSWLKIVPKGLGDLLRAIKDRYDNPQVIITENGVCDGSGLNDTLRIEYLYSYMKEMLIAINRDKCNVKAHTTWSLLDSFEWNFGYTNQYGLVQIDFSNENLTRTPKKSISWLRTVIETRELQSPEAFR